MIDPSWNATERAFDERPVHVVFEERAAATPEAIAIACGAGAWTYAEVNRRANQLARLLQRRGVTRESRVATLFARSEVMVIAQLAVLKAGGAYVPLDPTYPAARLAFMIANVGAKLLLSTRELASMVSADVVAVHLDEPAIVAALATEASDDLREACEPAQAAYVIYTSGTTGQPKGALIEHRSLANLVTQHLALVSLVASDRVSQVVSPAFDGTMNEIWPALTAGATLDIVDDDVRLSPVALGQWMRARSITVGYATTLLAEALLDQPWAGAALRVLCTGGQTLHRRPPASTPFQLVNIYGPTEATDYVTCEVVAPGDDPVTTIGRPIQNTRVYALDESGEPVAVGVYGELHLGGANVGRGYVGQPALTAARFVPDPHGPPGARLYRTGDRGRWSADGRLEFGGRTDDQVKVRGYRVELGEVEAALAAVAGVRECAVVAHTDHRGDTRLAAYVVGHAEPALDLESVKSELRRVLPDAMVPTAFVRLERLPLNTNGKLDRAALPAPSFTTHREYVAPLDAHEATVVEAFAMALGVPRVGSLDDFFELGGHSLLASTLAALLGARLGADVSVRAVFEARTPRRLASVLRERSSGASRARPALEVRRADRRLPLPLSSQEQRLWFLHRLDPAAPTYHECVALRVRGPLDQGALDQAFARLAERHEALRTRYLPGEEAPFRVVDPVGRPPAVTHLAAVDEPSALRALRDLARQPFDLEHGPLWRPVLVTLAEGEHIVALAMHHLVTDEWSGHVLFRDLGLLYAAVRSGGAAAISSSAVDYADWAALGADAGAAGVEAAVEHFVARLDGVENVELPADRVRPAQETFDGRTVRLRLDAGARAAVHALSSGEGTTIAVVMLTALGALVHRYTRTPRFAIAMAAAGRGRPELADLVGFFVNTLAIDFDFRGRPTFREALRRTREAVLDAQQYEDAPYDRVVERVVRARDPGRAPLCQVSFAAQPPQADVRSFAGLPAGRLPVDVGVAKFDLSLYATDQGDALELALEAKVALFDATTTSRMLHHVQSLLLAAVARPDQRVAALPWLPSSERESVLVRWNSTARPFDERPVHEAFEERAAATPEAIAVAHDDRQWTYADVNQRANRLARLLQRRGVVREARIATLFARSDLMIVAQLAVLKAGGAYAPLDPTHPAARSAFTIADVGAALVLSTTALSSGREASAPVLALDDPAIIAALAAESEDDLGVPCEPMQAAYVIYTSGTTGRPKGALIAHRSLANLVAQHRRLASLTATDRVSQVVSPAFDGTMNEIWPALTAGAVLDIVDDDVRLSPVALGQWLRARSISVGYTTTLLAEALLDEPWTGAALRVLCTGGQTLHRRPRADTPFQLVNIYGPTETTDYVTCEEVEPGDDAVTTIGRPIQNTQLYVLDEEGEPCPVGVYGELHVGGVNVGRGYVGQPALTASRFVPDPHGAAGARLYRTGDRGRWLADGRLQFAGRADDQVKVRGFRVELGEVEVALAACADVRECAVLAQTDASGATRLVGYVVARTDATLDLEAVKRELRSALPEAMVPSALVRVDRLPLNANGKLDRAALEARESAAIRGQYAAPRTPLEVTIAESWARTLGVERVGLHDDFFALGGHSLLATRVVARLRAALGIEVQLRLLFDAPTVEGLAAALTDAAPDARAGTLPRVARSGPLAASFAQERQWFLAQLDPEAPTYNVPLVVRIRGVIDSAALAAAVSDVVRWHEVLRTTFDVVDGQPRQVLHEATPIVVPVTRIAGAVSASALVRAEVERPFDLVHGPVIRARLFAIAPEEHVFTLVMHHIVTDRWSQDLIERELSEAYAAHRSGRPAPFAGGAAQYADFAAWQRASLAGDALQRQLDYWKTTLRGAADSLELPTDHPRPTTKRYRGSTVRFALPPRLAGQVAALARSEGATPFMVLLAAFDVLLARHTGETDILVGTPVANRPRVELEQMVGFFVNTLVVRTSLAGDPTFREVLRRVKGDALGAYDHQDVPFERLVEELQPARDPGRSPIFQVMFTHVSQRERGLALEGAIVSDETELDVSKFDLSLSVEEHDGALRGALEYDSDLFERATAEQLVERYRTLVEAASRQPDQRIASVAIMPEVERRRLVVEWNATDREDCRPAVCLHDLFEAQALRTPAAIAVEDERAALSYAELAARARRIAHWLETSGTRRGDRVAVTLERSADLLAAVLGVMMAGCAYVPMDPGFPLERREFMRSDSGCVAELSATTLAEALASPAPDAPRARRAEAADVAYVLYTSGSTGRPKGVMVSHANVVSFLLAMQQAPGIAATDTLVAVTTLSFDIAGLELYLPLTVGARVVIASRDTAQDGQALAALLQRTHATMMQATPATWRMLLDAGWSPSPALRMLCGGEALPPELVATLLGDGNELWNMYGPTETTIWSTCCLLERGAPITIGRPIANTRVYVLDRNDEPVPRGVYGELCIGGAGVTRGYLHRPELTAARFVLDPFDAANGSRIYRTGDRVRWTNAGALEFASRLDNQVKIRGFRIELGEIEAALGAIKGVREAAVTAREDTPGNKRLVAYVVRGRGAKLDTEQLQVELGRTLPEYMVPAVFVVLDALPLTPNGKIDRKALPAPDLSEAAATYVAARTPTETAIVAIFEKALNVERVGIDDNFFALGGHSLLAMRVVAAIRKALKREVKIRDFFEAPTVRRLAGSLDGVQQQSGPAGLPELARSQAASGSVTAYEEEYLLAWEAKRQPSPVWNHGERIDIKGPLDHDLLAEAVRLTLERQESLRRTFDRSAADWRPRLCAAEAITVERVDLRGQTAEAIDAFARERTSIPFPFDGTPLVRYSILRRGDDEHTLLGTWHQIVHDHDAAATGLLAAELFERYGALREGRAPALPALPIRQVDYAKWQRDWYAAPGGRAEIEAAQARLAGATPLALATQRNDAPFGRALHTVGQLLDGDTTARFERLCRAESLTRFMAAFSLVGVALRKISGQEDFVVMTIRSFRPELPALAHLTGRYAGTVPARLSVAGQPTWRELFSRGKKATLDAFAAAGPLPIAAVYGAESVPDHPLGALVLNDMGAGRTAVPQQAGDLTFVTKHVDSESGARIPLSVALFTPNPADGRLLLLVIAAADRFEKETVERISAELVALLTSIRLDESPFTPAR